MNANGSRTVGDTFESYTFLIEGWVYSLFVVIVCIDSYKHLKLNSKGKSSQELSKPAKPEKKQKLVDTSIGFKHR